MTTKAKPQTSMLKIVIPFALGYCLSYIFRTVNAVIAPDLVQELQLDANILGLLTSTYFLTFAAAQLPLGIVLDRWGPRLCESVLLLVAAAGALTFASATEVSGLVIGRGLIGFGVAACLMAAFKAYALWFPRHQLALVNGIQMAAGGSGALLAAAPTEALLNITDWRGVFIGLAVLCILVAVLIWWFIPNHRIDDASHSSNLSKGSTSEGLRQILRSKAFWRIAPVTTLSQATFLATQGLWAAPWMADVGHLDRSLTATILSTMAASMISGFLFFGWLTGRLNRAGINTLPVALVGMTCFMLLQLAMLSGLITSQTLLWIGYGFLGTTGILSYAALSQSFPKNLTGRVNTTLNLLVFIAAFAAQWGMGAIINLWQISPGIYGIFGYRLAFGVMLGGQVLGLLLTWLIRTERNNIAFAS
ncbi:MAG TPA: MFS transporter [Gammaproteobacteria bacterium]|nr:MFS transporter [Gammaproteobacteria bacterium]